MMSVGSEARFTANCKIFVLGAATIALLAITTAGPAAADPTAPNSGTGSQVAQIVRDPVYDPRVYNAPMSPLDMLLYNAPTEPGRGWYFGPTGSLSALRDADIIKRVDLGSSDTILRSSDSFRMPRSITGNSATWVSSSTSWLRSSDSLRLDREGSKTKVLTSSLGYDVGARAGYQFDNIRIEGQFDYANNSVDTFGRENRTFSTDFVMRDRTASGSTSSYTFLINGFVDVNVPYLSTYGATPYFGGGIGGGQTSLDLKWGNRTIVNSSDWGVAYQLGAGLRWQIMPNWSLDIGYRYKGISDVTLHNEFESIRVPNRGHNLEVGLLWNWGAIATVPPYTPPPPTTVSPTLWQTGPQFGPPLTPYTPPPPPPLLPPPPPRPPA
jgi:opacity protein-like surface antigen